MSQKIEKARDAVVIAQKEFDNAVATGNGINEAGITLYAAVDEYFDTLEAEIDAMAVESYLTKWNVLDNKENVLDGKYGVLH